jgi:hypothetical protein
LREQLTSTIKPSLQLAKKIPPLTNQSNSVIIPRGNTAKLPAVLYRNINYIGLLTALAACPNYGFHGLPAL